MPKDDEHVQTSLSGRTREGGRVAGQPEDGHGKCDATEVPVLAVASSAWKPCVPIPVTATLLLPLPTPPLFLPMTLAMDSLV